MKAFYNKKMLFFHSCISTTERARGRDRHAGIPSILFSTNFFFFFLQKIGFLLFIFPQQTDMYLNAPSQFSSSSIPEYNQSLSTNLQDLSSSIFQVQEASCQLLCYSHNSRRSLLRNLRELIYSNYPK